MCVLSSNLLELTLRLLLPLCLPLSVCLSLSASLCLPLSVCLSLSASLCLPLSVCLSLSASLSICLSLSASLYLPLSLCLSLYLSPSLLLTAEDKVCQRELMDHLTCLATAKAGNATCMDTYRTLVSCTQSQGQKQANALPALKKAITNALLYHVGVTKKKGKRQRFNITKSSNFLSMFLRKG
jgi:hypothetical protein